MTLLVHLLQYRLHLSEITDTKNNGRYQTTDPIIGTSLVMLHIVYNILNIFWVTIIYRYNNKMYSQTLFTSRQYNYTDSTVQYS